MHSQQIPRGGGWWVAGAPGDGKKYGLLYCSLLSNMELHNNSFCYAFLYQNMEFNIIKIIKEIVAKKF